MTDTRREWSDADLRVRRAALAELVLILPVLLLGIVLTLSLYGIYFGVPLLLVTVPVLVAVRRARARPDDDDTRRWLAAASAFVAVVFAVGLLALVAAGRDDLDSPGDVAAAGVGVIWVAAAWAVAATCWNEARRG